MLPFPSAMLMKPASSGGFSSSTITIASGKVASNLTNYPVYLRLSDMPAGFWTAVDSDGGNIRVKQSGSVIPFDIVKFDKVANTGTIFFKASSLLTASNNVFTLDLTGSGLLAATDTNGRNAVWSAFDFVCMLDDASTFTDRTGGAGGSLATGSVTFSATTLGAGCGLDFSSARIAFTGRTSRSVFTLAATGDATNAAFGSTTGNRAALEFGSSSTSRCNFGIQDATDSYNGWDNSNSWVHNSVNSLDPAPATRVHLVYNSTTNRKLYTQGALRNTDTTITARSTDVNYHIGNNAGNTGAWQGTIAYAYARPEALSDNFIAAEYANLNNPTGFYAIT